MHILVRKNLVHESHFQHKKENELLSKVDVIAPEEYTAFLTQLIQDLETLPYEMTRRILHNAIHKILVHEKKVEVFLHVGEYILEVDSSPEAQNDNENTSDDHFEKNLQSGSNTLTINGPTRAEPFSLKPSAGNLNATWS